MADYQMSLKARILKLANDLEENTSILDSLVTTAAKVKEVSAADFSFLFAAYRTAIEGAALARLHDGSFHDPRIQELGSKFEQTATEYEKSIITLLMLSRPKSED